MQLDSFKNLKHFTKVFDKQVNLTDSVLRCQMICPFMTQSHIDTQPVSLTHGTPVFISKPLTSVYGTESIKSIYRGFINDGCITLLSVQS